MRKYQALVRKYRALVRKYRALVQKYRALVQKYMDLLRNIGLFLHHTRFEAKLRIGLTKIQNDGGINYDVRLQ